MTRKKYRIEHTASGESVGEILAYSPDGAWAELMREAEDDGFNPANIHRREYSIIFVKDCP